MVFADSYKLPHPERVSDRRSLSSQFSGDYYHRAISSFFFQFSSQRCVCLEVRAEKLSSKKYLGPFQQRSGYGKPLLLSARYICPALGNWGVIPFFFRGYEFDGPGDFGSPFNFFLRSRFIGVFQVRFYGSAEEDALLGDVAYALRSRAASLPGCLFRQPGPGRRRHRRTSVSCSAASISRTGRADDRRRLPRMAVKLMLFRMFFGTGKR